MNTVTRTLLLAMFAPALACNVKHANENNDTQLGDDDGGAMDTGGEEPDAVVDHGIAQYCVDRAVAFESQEPGTFLNLADVQKHELWFTPLGRQYKNHLDISDKPSPMQVPLGCPFGWPHEDLYAADAATRGGSPSCLNSGYHLQIPWVGFADYIDPSHARFPYSRDIIVGTVGNPPESGRHTWAAPGCCGVSPTAAELQGVEWQYAMVGLPPGPFTGPSADCAAYVATLGVHASAAGYDAAYDKPTMLTRAVTDTTCLTPGQYSIVIPIKIAAAKLGGGLWYHPGRYVEQLPVNLNFDWVSSLGLISWDDLEAFGDTIDAVIQALISNLYLPPDGFEHARYALGGGCHFPTALRWSSSVGDIVARYTCPIGYYATFPSFVVDTNFVDRGLVGACILDGVDGDGLGLVDGGAILSPTFDETGDGLAVRPQTYTVHDVSALAIVLGDAAAVGVVTPALADLLAGGEVLEGDTIAWWSSPWEEDPLSLPDSLVATLGYDVEDLVLATGWTYAQAEAFVDNTGFALVKDVLPSVSGALENRPVQTMRARLTLRLRFERATPAGTKVMFAYFVPEL